MKTLEENNIKLKNTEIENITKKKYWNGKIEVNKYRSREISQKIEIQIFENKRICKYKNTETSTE